MLRLSRVTEQFILLQECAQIENKQSLRVWGGYAAYLSITHAAPAAAYYNVSICTT